VGNSENKENFKFFTESSFHILKTTNRNLISLEIKMNQSN